MTISRRQFCTTVGAAAASVALPAMAADETSTSLRVIAYNVYVCRGWPDGRPLAKQVIEHGQMPERLAMELALHAPDIINFSESPSEAVTQAIAERLGMHHARFPSGGNWPGTLLSRFEITQAQNVPLGRERPPELFYAPLGRATLGLPGGQSLIVHSAHLYPTADPAIRLQEIKAMLETMQEDLAAGRSMLLIGDLNHTPDTQEYKLWTDAGWVDTFASVGQGDGFTIRADKPARRIDYVMAAGPIAEKIRESRPLFEGAFRVNVDDERSFALSDHLPQLAIFD